MCAREAGNKIMDLYKKDCPIYEKDDHTPVTDADLASNRILNSGLTSILPIPMLSEEEEISHDEIANWDEFWVIDPLDGTKGFINQSDDFAINIAIVKNGEAVFGMLYIPVSGDAYYAARGQGAFRLTDGKWRRIKTRSKEMAGTGKNKPHKIIFSKDGAGPKTQEMVADIGIPDMGCINIGSAIKFALIATGEATIYPRFGPTAWWDTAAGQCIVEEAGGKTMDGELHPLSYDNPGSVINPNFIVYAFDDARWNDPWQKINKRIKEEAKK